MKIWHIRENKKQDYVIVDDKLILDRSGKPKRHKGKIIATLVLFEDNIGWSMCCPEDRFSKKVGVSIALGRAKNPKQMQIPTKIKKHVKKMAHKYEVKLPELPEIPPPTKKLKWEDVKEGTVLTVQMKYEDDPSLFSDWALDKADLSEISKSSLIIGENAIKDPSGIGNSIQVMIGQCFHYPPQVFGIEQ